MKLKPVALFVSVAILVITAAVPAEADSVTLPDGSKLDLSVPCPVCNMNVGSTKLGPAAVVFNDGKVVGFDGAGDFFRFVLDPKKFTFDTANIKTMFVTQYGTKNFIDVKQAFFVLGSDVKGTMGPDAVAFAKREDARKFASEHHGKKIASFNEVTLTDLKAAKKMLKMKHGH